MKNDFEEYFYSDNLQEIENERKKRNALISMFPNLMGNEDKTKYVLRNGNTAKQKDFYVDKHQEQKDSVSFAEDKNRYSFDPWEREKTLDSINKINYLKLNGEIGSIPIQRPAYHEDEFEYMNKAKFNSVIENSFKFEGGYSNNKNDRGGKTNHGITRIFMEQYKNALPGGKVKPVEELTKEDAYNLYFAMWNNKKLGYIRDKNLAFVLNDYMINSSEWEVAKRVQRILNRNGENIKENGVFNSNTLEAIHRADKEWLMDQILIDRYNNYRKQVEKSHSQIDFYKGWIKRLNDVAEIIGSKLRFDEKYKIYEKNNSTFLLGNCRIDNKRSWCFRMWR